MDSRSSTPLTRYSSSVSDGKPGTAPKKDRFEVAENYRLVLPKDFELPPSGETKGLKGVFEPTIWLQGNNEDTHGISDSLLSVLPIRASEVLDGILREGNFRKAVK